MIKSLKAIGWLGVFLFFFMLATHFVPLHIAVFSGGSTTGLMFLLFIANERLFRSYYLQGKEKKFLLVSIVLVLVFAITQTLLDHYVIFPHRVFEFPMHVPRHFPHFRSFVVFIMGNAISIAFLLSEQLRKTSVKEKQLQEDKLGTEIKLLKAQINPHFIFNALNNIYTLTYIKADNAPDSVLKLSDMLRYVLDDCSKEHVPLSSEIQYLEHYISFQQMKSEADQNIRFTYDEEVSSKTISPMLLIPFVENSFKYSRIEAEEEAFVNIDLYIEKNTLRFFISNSISNHKGIPKGNGMGIENVKQRLDLLYNEGYDLSFQEKHDVFTVELKITLQ